tara:strand:+ start:3618 stop:4106 length:489 start_codon:yes stop_codon:yes gene_type:complete
MDRTLIMFLAAAVAVTFLVVMATAENYKKSGAFASGNNFITLDDKGNIVLQPVSDVDTAINNVAAGITTDTTNTLKGYQTTAAASSYQASAGKTFQTKAAAAAAKTAADAAYQSAGNYLTRGKFYRIWNKEGDQNVLRWGNQIKTDGNTNATDQFRYFKIDN